MPISTITSKGQVTIPRKIRDQLHLNTGDKLEFHVTANEILVSPITGKVADSFAILAKSRKPRLSVDEMNRKLGASFRKIKV